MKHEIVVTRPRNVIHWIVPGGTQFVTWRVAGTLPASASKDWRQRDAILDGWGGGRILHGPAAAAVASSLHHFDNDRYRLLAYAVMPNHVHVIVQAATLSSVVQSWKSFSSKAINQLNGTHGTVWQRDYFDYWIRDAIELRNLMEYVRQNPVQAGLEAWPHVWVRSTDGTNI